VLAGYAHHRRPTVRARAVWALGQLDDKRAVTLAYAGFTDEDKVVRAAACKVVEERKDASQTDELINLLLKNDEAVAPALAAIGTPALARKLSELFGQAPDDLLARTLGLMLLRPDLGKEDVYVELVNTIAKIPGEEAITALSTFISKTPETPPRAARKRAQEQYDQRLSGGAK
jgi:HEAT repeat protein